MPSLQCIYSIPYNNNITINYDINSNIVKNCVVCYNLL